MSLILAFAVEVHLMEMLGDGRVEVILLARVLQHVGVGSLSAVLIIGMEVQSHHIGRLGHQSESCVGFIVTVGFLVIVVIGEVSFGMCISESSRESQSAGYTVVMSGTCSGGAVGGTLQVDVCTLVVERVLGADAYESAHGIASVQCALRSAQDVDALHITDVKVIGALVGPEDIVHIESHSGCVDAASHSSHVYGCGLSASVSGDEEIGYVGCKVGHAVHAFADNLMSVYGSRSQRLVSQCSVILAVAYCYLLHQGGVGLLLGICRSQAKHHHRCDNSLHVNVQNRYLYCSLLSNMCQLWCKSTHFLSECKVP